MSLSLGPDVRGEQAPLSNSQETTFAHPSEEEFAALLDFYRIRWEYEPRTFPLLEDEDGNILEGFTPDFYLPDFEIYIELTTKKPNLMTPKHKKIQQVMDRFPGVKIKLLDRVDYHALLLKYRGRGAPEKTGVR